jgi:drug/metabolite transporter (DMT)-like permease
MSMAVAEFKKLNRQMMLYRVVQTILVGLLAFVAINFQGVFALRGKPEQFIASMVVAIIVQLLLIYPVYKLAWRDAGIEIEGNATGLTSEQLTALRKKRLIGDLWKFCGVAFFIVFVALIPDAKKAAGATFFLSTTIFSFLITCLLYFQCFNFSAKKQIKSIT